MKEDYEGKKTEVETHYADFLVQYEADNTQIDFELGVLDQAELVLYQEGIMRTEV